MPFAEINQAGSSDLSPRDYLHLRKDMNELGNRLTERGWDPEDLHSGHVGRIGGKLMVTDPGAMNYPTGYMPPEALPTQGPGRVQNALLRMLGSDQMVHSNTWPNRHKTPLVRPSGPSILDYIRNTPNSLNRPLYDLSGNVVNASMLPAGFIHG